MGEDKSIKAKPKARAERLAAALRDNLKRRKAQARAQAGADDPAVASEALAKKDCENR